MPAIRRRSYWWAHLGTRPGCSWARVPALHLRLDGSRRCRRMCSLAHCESALDGLTISGCGDPARSRAWGTRPAGIGLAAGMLAIRRSCGSRTSITQKVVRREPPSFRFIHVHSDFAFSTFVSDSAARRRTGDSRSSGLMVGARRRSGIPGSLRSLTSR